MTLDLFQFREKNKQTKKTSQLKLPVQLRGGADDALGEQPVSDDKQVETTCRIILNCVQSEEGLGWCGGRGTGARYSEVNEMGKTLFYLFIYLYLSAKNFWETKVDPETSY